MTKQTLDHLRLLICDVDGVLTDGQITFLPDGTELKFFNTQDGMGLKTLQKAGIKIIWLSGRRAEVVEKRATELGIDQLYQGITDKPPIFKQILDDHQITAQDVAYIGDDTPDAAIMQQVGLAITVANATPDIMEIAHWQTVREGGHGAVREACDYILAQRSNH